jgi:hypothetical protein
MSTTTEQINRIHRYLEALGRRKRRFLVVRTIALGCVCVLLCLILAAVAFSFGVSRAGVGIGLVATATPTAVWGFLQIVLPRWSRSKSLKAQAQTMEAALPGLRSRLITVIEREEELARDRPLFSVEMFARAATHAHTATAVIRLGELVSIAPVKRSIGGVLIALLAAMVAGSVLPIGPFDAISVLMGKSAAALRMADAVAGADADAAVVGDITLRYIYPDYTGLADKVVPNSDGTIHAPPGTVVQISARTAERVDSAAVQVDNQDPIDAQLSGGRDLSANITVNFDGSWRVLLFEGDAVQSSVDYQVVVEADAAPVIVTSETGEQSVPVDRAIGLGWTVTDDYGIARVALSVEKDGEVTEYARREPIDSVLELNGAERNTPRALGLSPGDKVVLHIVAIDNDKSNGGNIGKSEPLVLTILGAKGYGRQLTRYHQRLLDHLLDALGDFLEEVIPPAESNRGMLAWAGTARKRLTPIHTLFADQWGDEATDAVDAVVLQRVMDASARLFRFTAITFDVVDGTGEDGVRRAGRQPVRQDLDTFVKMHGETIESLEQASWLIDSMLRQVAFREVVQRAEQVADEAAELAKFSQEDPAADALLARLDQLARLMDQLQRAAAKLAEGQMQEFVNSRMREAGAQMDAARKAIAEGRLAEAQKMIEALAEQLQQFAEGLSEQMSRQGEGDDELKERYEQLIKDLDTLQDDQDQLGDEVAAAREEHGADLDERMSIWAQLDTLATAAVTASSATLDIVGDGSGWQSYSMDRVERLNQTVRGVQDAVQARNATGSLERVLDGQRYGVMTQRVIAMEGDRRRTGEDRAPPNLERANSQVAQLGRTLQRMRQLLEEMNQSPNRSNPALEQAARSLSQRQAGLRERTRSLEQEVGTVEQAIPTGNGDAKRSIEGAGVAMERAGAALEQGDAMGGEGNQRDAARKVGNTRDNLQREMAEYQQMQRMMKRMGGEGGEGGDKDGEQNPQPPMNQPEIPAPEAFRTPEEYRRNVLEGMAAEVPEQFQALKKRFYEDLVRQ